MKKAFMAVSIRNPFYSNKNNIVKAINLAKDLDEFLIFVVDYPYRLSLQAFDNIPKKEAEEISMKEGKELMIFLEKIAKDYNNTKVKSWKGLENEEYYNFLSEIKELEKKDKKFSDLIKGEFSGVVINKLSGNNNSESEALSREFIMEEVAMFSSLVSKGYMTRISRYDKSKSIDYFLRNKNLLLNHLTIK